MLELLTLHELDQHSDTFIVIHQAFLVTVEQGIGIQAGGVDPGDGICETGKVFCGCALVGTKDTIVFPGEGCTETILQQAGGAYNQRAFSGLVQELA